MYKLSLPVIVGASLLAGASLVLAADGISERYAPVLVSDPPAATQDLGKGLAVDGRGNFVAAWTEQSERDGGTWFDVLARRISFNGTPLGAAFAVDGDTNVHLWPATGSDADGNFVIAWVEAASANLQNLSIHARRFAADGTPRAAAVAVSAVDAPADSAPQIAVNAAGDHVIVWFRKGTPDVAVARVFDAAGSPLGPEFTLPLLDGDNPRLVGVALTAERHVAVGAAIRDPFNLLPIDIDDLKLQCFDDQGVALGAATEMVSGSESYPDASNGQLSATPDGRIYMAWPQVRVDNILSAALSEVRIAAFDSDCTTLAWNATPLSVLNLLGSVQGVSLASTASGDGPTVGWVFDDGSRQSAFFRRYDSSGAALSDPTTIVADDNVAVSAPQLALRRHGLSAAWSQLNRNSVATYTDVYAKGFFTATTPDLFLSAQSLDFGEHETGTTSAALILPLHNDGSAALTVSSVTAGGDYSVSANTCAAAVAPGGSCAVSVTFTPSAAGVRSGSLEIASNADDSPAIVALSGAGTAGNSTGGNTTGSNSGGSGGAMPWPLLLGFLLAAKLRRRRDAPQSRAGAPSGK